MSNHTSSQPDQEQGQQHQHQQLQQYKIQYQYHHHYHYHYHYHQQQVQYQQPQRQRHRQWQYDPYHSIPLTQRPLSISQLEEENIRKNKIMMEEQKDLCWYKKTLIEYPTTEEEKKWNRRTNKGIINRKQREQDDLVARAAVLNTLAEARAAASSSAAGLAAEVTQHIPIPESRTEVVLEIRNSKEIAAPAPAPIPSKTTTTTTAISLSGATKNPAVASEPETEAGPTLSTMKTPVLLSSSNDFGPPVDQHLQVGRNNDDKEKNEDEDSVDDEGNTGVLDVDIDIDIVGVAVAAVAATAAANNNNITTTRTTISTGTSSSSSINKTPDYRCGVVTSRKSTTMATTTTMNDDDDSNNSEQNEIVKNCVVHKPWLCTLSDENQCCNEGKLFEEVIEKIGKKEIFCKKMSEITLSEITLTEIVRPIYETFSDDVNTGTGERKANFKKMELRDVDLHSQACNNQLVSELGKNAKNDPFGLRRLLKKNNLIGKKLEEVVSNFTGLTSEMVGACYNGEFNGSNGNVRVTPMGTKNDVNDKKNEPQQKHTDVKKKETDLYPGKEFYNAIFPLTSEGCCIQLWLNNKKTGMVIHIPFGYILFLRADVDHGGGLLTAKSHVNGNARFHFYLTLNDRDYQQFSDSGTNAYDDSENFEHDPKLTDIFFPVPDPKNRRQCREYKDKFDF